MGQLHLFPSPEDLFSIIIQSSSKSLSHLFYFQANVRYNKPLGASLNGERPRFSLKVQVKRDLDRCDRRSLHINVW